MQKSYLKEHEAIKLHILAEVSQQITSILDINELLVRVVRLIQQTFNYYHVGIGLIEGEVAQADLGQVAEARDDRIVG